MTVRHGAAALVGQRFGRVMEIVCASIDTLPASLGAVPGCSPDIDTRSPLMGFSGGHLLLILLILGIGLIVFGPKRLPEIGSGFGKAIREFKVGVTELHGSAVPTSASHDQTPAPALPVATQAPINAAPATSYEPRPTGQADLAP